ncbi:unnamed protein product [Rhizophagus irregularis]|uniref:Uncharacterized protein n=1 Tax=Rhizophagus irregularis TaxID=588596 RepID=A0A2I1H9R3_9GLOM|nr:hypothetical protein RhiirA4_475200 [Rhizophagus irregularis]CAB4410262.1 unnamed protein product [Rhizophagus irregularis]CAB4446405.1 unnamed protein product [Rhizophagus irregularis]
MEEDMGKGLQMKDQDEIIGKNGKFTKVRYRDTTNNSARSSSEDEQFEDVLTSPKLPAVSTVSRSNEEIEDYTRLNNEFSNRISKISDNASAETSSKKGKTMEPEEDNCSDTPGQQR